MHLPDRHWDDDMPAPLITVETTAQLPAKADVVVIGGGIIGVCSAYYLARRGVDVVLIEKGRIGTEQSSRNWGWCRQQNRDARELPVATRSLALWDAMAEELGESVGFRRCGLVYLSDDEAELATWAKWREFAITEGVDTRMLSGTDLDERQRITGRRWKGGVWSGQDGTADPSRAAPMIARGVETFGGTVVQMCAARGIETEAGRVSGVVTEKGVIRTSQVVMAGGAWASSFCRQMGIRFPQASLRASVLSVHAADGTGLPDALHTSRVTVTRRGNGAFMLAIGGRAMMDPTFQTLRFGRQFLPMFLSRRKSVTAGGLQALGFGHERLRGWALDRETPMERTRSLDPEPSKAIIAEIISRAQDLLPGMRDCRIEQTWGGYIDSTPDGVPVIDQLESTPGFLLAAGFSGHGFGIGPGAGYLIADMITGQVPYVDPRQYLLRRFDRSSWGKVADF